MCNVTVTLGTRTWNHSTGFTESEVMRAAAEHLLDLDESELPCLFQVEVDTLVQPASRAARASAQSADTPANRATWKVSQRGTYTKDGVKHPSIHAQRTSGHLYMPRSDYDPAYLVCLNPESNNYKFYWIHPEADGIHARYGRVGGSALFSESGREVKCPYDFADYWVLYFEKLSKGYTDETATYLGGGAVKSAEKRAEKSVRKEHSVASELFNLLSGFARGAVRRHVVEGVPVTQARVERARAELDAMRESKDTDEFNAHLIEVLKLSPRRVDHVNTLLATGKRDFREIITREENLLSAMEGTVIAREVEGDGFEELGIEVHLANERQRAQVMRHLDDSTKGRVKRIWYVRNRERQQAFDAYREREGIHGIKLLWHGSVNENWLSLINQGQKLHPNARITGKMFGDGLYFAPSAKKSLGYTSTCGSYWAHGSEERGYMALVAVATGKTLDTYRHHRYTAEELRQAGCNSVWAHAGRELYNDEVIVYDEDACVIDYLVEFE